MKDLEDNIYPQVDNILEIEIGLETILEICPENHKIGTEE